MTLELDLDTSSLVAAASCRLRPSVTTTGAGPMSRFWDEVFGIGLVYLFVYRAIIQREH